MDYLINKYHQPPPNLEQTLHSVIERLEDGNLIKLSNKPISLPYYLASPVEELDLDKARKLIQEDGYSNAGQLH